MRRRASRVGNLNILALETAAHHVAMERTVTITTEVENALTGLVDSTARRVNLSKRPMILIRR